MVMHAGAGRHGERLRGGHLLRLDGRAGRVLRHEPHSRCAQRVSGVIPPLWQKICVKI